MAFSVRTMQQHILGIDGTEFHTTFEPVSHIEPHVTEIDNGLRVTYATYEDSPENPLNLPDSPTTVFITESCRGMYNDSRSELPSHIEDALTVATAFVDWRKYALEDSEPFYAILCGCWASHTLEQVEQGACYLPHEILLFGTAEQMWWDGMVEGGCDPTDHADLYNAPHLDTIAHMWEALPGAELVDLMKIFLARESASVTAIAEVNLQGLRQSDWAKGFAWTEVRDPSAEKMLLADLELLDHYWSGEAYMVVAETYSDVKSDDLNMSDDYDLVGGFYGDKYTQEAVMAGI